MEEGVGGGDNEVKEGGKRRVGKRLERGEGGKEERQRSPSAE